MMTRGENEADFWIGCSGRPGSSPRGVSRRADELLGAITEDILGSHGSDFSEHQSVRTSTTSEAKELGAVDVEIQGQTLSIRSDHNPEFVERIAEYVDAKVGELEDAAPGAPTDKLLMMASLTVAEELFEARGEIEDLRREIRERTADMQALIDELED